MLWEKYQLIVMLIFLKLLEKLVREIGYTRAKYGFDCDTCAVITSIDEQSADIAMGVDEAFESKKGEKDED